MIHKYPLDIVGAQKLALPVGAIVRHVGVQADDHGERIRLWAEYAIEAIPVRTMRTFAIYGTGHLFDPAPGDTYIGTVHMRGGALVFHVYEVDIDFPHDVAGESEGEE